MSWLAAAAITVLAMQRWQDPVPTLKQQIADEIVAALHGWTLANAGSWLHVDHARVSDLRRGRLDRLSLERLIRMISHIDRRVELRIIWTPRSSCFLKPGDRMPIRPRGVKFGETYGPEVVVGITPNHPSQTRPRPVDETK
jgi:predicted XRE-type DNA-binding protein